MRCSFVAAAVLVASMVTLVGCKGGESPAIQVGGSSGTSSTSAVGGRTGGADSGGGAVGHTGGVGMGGTFAGGTAGIVAGGSGPSGGSGGVSGLGGTGGQGGTGGVGGNGTGGIGSGSVCLSGQTMCGSVCVHKATNPDHCGMCDYACGGATTCVDGQCVNTPQWDTAFRIGTAAEPAFNFSATDSPIQAAADGQGNVFVAWPWDAGNGTKLWVNRYDGTQGAWSGAIEVDSGVTDTLQPFLAAHTNGDATLVYRKLLNNGVVPYAKRYQRSRGAWDASPTLLCNGCDIRRYTRDYNGTSNFRESVNAASSENGDVVVVWDSPTVPFVNIFDHTTGTWSGESRNIDDQIKVSLNDEVRDVRLSMDRSGNATMVRLTRFQFYFNRYDASTKTWTAHARIPIGTQTLPTPNSDFFFLCQSPTGDVALTWLDATGRKVVASIFNSTLASWPSEPRVVVSLGNTLTVTTNSHLVQKRCVLTPDGSVVMGINDSNVRLLGVRLAASAPVGDPLFPILITETDAPRGEMAVSDPSGNVVVVSNLGSARYDARSRTWTALNDVGQPARDYPNSLVFDVRGRALRVSSRMVPSSQDPNRNWAEIWGQWLK